MVFSNVGNLAG